MAKYSAGDKIVFGRCKDNKGAEDITIGKIYDVLQLDGAAFFYDDDKDVRFQPLESGRSYKVTKIVE